LQLNCVKGNMKASLAILVICLAVFSKCTYSSFPVSFVGTWTLSNTQSTPCLGSTTTTNTPCSTQCQYIAISSDGKYFVNVPLAFEITDYGTYSVSGNQITFVSTFRANLTYQMHMIGNTLISSPAFTPAGCTFTSTYTYSK
jgi:hypothetical protein